MLHPSMLKSLNPILVHAHEMNPVDYAIASISVAGLHEEEITISFAKMIHQKNKSSGNRNNFPIIC